MNSIFTIGHSINSIDFFVAELKHFEIDCIADVRSVPHSKFASQFNRENLSVVLKNNSIKYVFLGKELGARRNEFYLFTQAIDEQFLDFEKVSVTADFLAGIERVVSGMNKGYNIAIMCTEDKAIDCHRTILVARALVNRGIYVDHIEYNFADAQKHYFPNNEKNNENRNFVRSVFNTEFVYIKTHKTIEENLVELHQKSLRGNLFDQQSAPPPIIEAYQLQNKKIGYKFKSKNDFNYDE